MVGDLTQFLFQNNMLRYIEGYVQKVSPQKTPAVVGALLDAEAPEEFVTNLILSVRSLLPVDKVGVRAIVEGQLGHYNGLMAGYGWHDGLLPR